MKLYACEIFEIYCEIASSKVGITHCEKMSFNEPEEKFKFGEAISGEEVDNHPKTERKLLEACPKINSESEINTPDDLLHVMSRFGNLKSEVAPKKVAEEHG